MDVWQQIGSRGRHSDMLTSHFQLAVRKKRRRRRRLRYWWGSKVVRKQTQPDPV